MGFADKQDVIYDRINVKGDFGIGFACLFVCWARMRMKFPFTKMEKLFT